MVSALSKGDEVITQGGILGKITKVNEGFVTLEVSNNVSMTIQKASIGSLMPKGTIKEQNS